MQKKISISQIKDAAQEAFDLYKTKTDGKNADYIPNLAKKNKNLFLGFFYKLLDISLDRQV